MNVLERVDLEAKGKSTLDLDASELARMIANKEITSVKLQRHILIILRK